MACANCEALRTRVQFLEQELGLRRRDGAVAALMVRMGLSPIQAALILVLYESKGRVVSNEHLRAPTRIASDGSLKASISRINSEHGGEVITNIWGQGYHLSTKGMAMVHAALEPPEIQPSRGP